MIFIRVPQCRLIAMTDQKYGLSHPLRPHGGIRGSVFERETHSISDVSTEAVVQRSIPMLTTAFRFLDLQSLGQKCVGRKQRSSKDKKSTLRSLVIILISGKTLHPTPRPQACASRSLVSALDELSVACYDKATRVEGEIYKLHAAHPNFSVAGISKRLLRR